MYQLRFLHKENDLNKILRNTKRPGSGRFSILFTSLWDEYSQALVEELKEAYGESETGVPLYVVDSWDMPHSFVIYNTTKLPHLVTVSDRGTQSEDYLPSIRRILLKTRKAR